MKTKLTVATIVVVLFFCACKKVTNNPQENISDQSISNKASSSTGKGIGPAPTIKSTLLYQAPTSELTAFEATFDSSVIGSITGSGRPPVCPVFVDANSVLESATLTSGSFCAGTATVDVTYLWMVYEGPGAYDPSPSTFTFKVIDQGLVPTTHTGTIVGTPTQSPLTCDPRINACGHVFRFEITVTLTGSQYGSTTNTTNRTTGVGLSGCLSLQDIDKSVSLDYSQGYYTGNPALVNLDNSGVGNIQVFTECSLLCYPPHTLCPSLGHFSYRIYGSGSSYTTTTFPTTGLFLTGLPSGTTYEYQCVLDYSFGSSQIKYGLITTN